MEKGDKVRVKNRESVFFKQTGEVVDIISDGPISQFKVMIDGRPLNFQERELEKINNLERRKRY